MAKVTAVCTSSKRQEPKKPRAEGVFVEGKGIEGDSHFGMVERQISLLRAEDIREAEQTAGFSFPPGSLAENLVVEGLPEELVPGEVLALGPSVRLRVAEKGKKPGEPHSYDYRGWCLLPVQGYFLSVERGGRVVPGDEAVLEREASGPHLEEKSLRQRAEEFLEALRRRGCRRTEQRRLIIEILLESEGEHLNARELMDRVQSRDPSIGFATVYRTLLLLGETGLVHSFDQGEGFARFDIPRETMHFHILCRSCGRMGHLPDEAAKQEIVKSWIREAGFEMVPQTFQVYGLCSECRDKGVPGCEAERNETCCGRRRHGWNR
jgi:Fur family ferric uptake transcriptional regulator